MWRKDDLRKFRCYGCFSLKNKALWLGLVGATFSNWHLLLLEILNFTCFAAIWDLFTVVWYVFEATAKPDTGYFVLV
jgi:hypothetical protein